MITEDYCSFELSKLLKEKGFDIFCDRGWESIDYDKDHDVNCYPYNKPYPFNEEKRSILSVSRWMSAPTHQMAMKWLRKAHKIYADPIQQGNYDDNSIYYTYIVAQIIDGKSYIHRPMSVVDKLSYEEAVEAALKYVLENLI